MTMISHKLQLVTTFTNTDITLNPVKHHFRCSRLHFKNFEVPEKEKRKTIRSMYFRHFTYQCVGTECLYASMTYTAVIKDRRCRGSVDTPTDVTDLYHKWAASFALGMHGQTCNVTTCIHQRQHPGTTQGCQVKHYCHSVRRRALWTGWWNSKCVYQ